METAQITSDYYEEKEHNIFSPDIIFFAFLAIIAIIVLAVTIGLYFGLRYLNAWQHYFSRQMEFAIPAVFLISCSVALCAYFYWKLCEDEGEIGDNMGEEAGDYND
ncbi:MAG: hypothetical protein PHQ42_03325 [Patescibacteria group bacterium]|nr:hypothetical protein [Patescibacteria group bacterium]